MNSRALVSPKTYNRHMTKNSQNSDGKLGIIFIHGAGLGGWIWHDVTKNISVPHICADYTSLERSNSKTILNDYVEATYQQVEQLRVERVVIVAHSVGGVVGAELSIKLGDRLAAFVGVSAAIPKPGGSFVSTLPFPQKIILPIILKLAGTKPPESAIRSGLGNGLSPSQTDKVVAKFQQESLHLYIDKISNIPISKVRTMYLRTTNDKEFSLSMQNASIANLNEAKVFDINSGHMPMLSNADMVSKHINDVLKQS